MTTDDIDMRAKLNADLEECPPDARALGRLLTGRHSCRAYRPETVPRATIEHMLRLAQMSPSWCNSQPWQVIVTEGDGTARFRTALSAAAAADHGVAQSQPRIAADLPFPANYTGIYKDRQRAVGWQLYESVGIAYGDRTASGAQMMKNFELFGAPHALIITSERDLGVYGAIDCGLYVQALLLAAQSLGVAMIAQAALAAYAPLIRSHFDIPENRIVVVGGSFGFADITHPANSFRSARADLDQVARWVDT